MLSFDNYLLIQKNKIIGNPIKRPQKYCSYKIFRSPIDQIPENRWKNFNSTALFRSMKIQLIKSEILELVQIVQIKFRLGYYVLLDDWLFQTMDGNWK